MEAPTDFIAVQNPPCQPRFLPLPSLSFGIPTFQKITQKTTRLHLANIAYSEKSPGRTFQLDEDALVEYLDRLENLTDGAFRYDETAGVKQVYRDRKIASTELLHRYYLK